MLSCDHQVRLTARERRQLAMIAGTSPDHIKTRTQLEDFVGAQRRKYPGRSPEETLMRRLLESFLKPS